MAPEAASAPQETIIDESRRIVGALEPIQEQATAAARAAEEPLLASVRAQLGYLPPEEVDTSDLVDTRIAEKRPVITPTLLARAVPLSRQSAETTRSGRINVEQIIKGEDDRLIVIVGPCSLHDPQTALEYAERVREWRDEYGDDLEIVMRAYTEKPRTTTGWKGMTYDPLITQDKNADLNLGLTMTRMLACRITDMGVPIAMERLHGLTPQYLNGLVTYDAIGARNVTDQNAREYGSATSSVVGVKNGIDGGVQEAVEAIVTINSEHQYLGTDMNAEPSMIGTAGNDTAHLILRGGKNGPNYGAEHVEHAKQALHKKNLLDAIIVDTNHGNSGKDYKKQIGVIHDVALQVSAGETALRGVMIESNVAEGNQQIAPLEELTSEQSITDACVGLDETQLMLSILAKAVRERRQKLNQNKDDTQEDLVLANT